MQKDGLLKEKRKDGSSQEGRYMPVIPALGRQQEDHKFSLG
jgi:hypothetical protein